MSTYPPNQREKTEAIAHWLGYHHENIAYGLRSVADAEKLYDYWQQRGDLLPEYCDEECDDPNIDVRQHRIAAIGYDPMQSTEEGAVKFTVDKAQVALVAAEKLLASVAFVAKEGDTKRPLRLIRAAMAAQSK